MLAEIIRTVTDVVKKSLALAGNEARDYYGAILTYATSLSNHTISSEEFIRVVEETIVNAAEAVYEQAAGVDYALEEEDFRLIQDWHATQVRPLENLADDISASGITPDIDRRLRLWASSLSSLGSIGYMQSHRNKQAEWRTNPMSKEKCETCSALNGHIHTLGWYLDKGYIPGQPGSATLICGGWGCKCGLYDTTTGRRLLPLVRMWNTGGR